jgi:ornithine decarboxylase
LNAIAAPARPGFPTEKLEAFLADNEKTGAIETPFVVLDLDVVAERYDTLRAVLPQADVFYAVKANPGAEILQLLAARGGCFDVASPNEVDYAFAAGATADRISYGNTIKKSRDIVYAYGKGVRHFAFDSEGELEKLISHAPGAIAFCRILCDGAGADWPLSRKFGCEPEEALRLLRIAAANGLRVGVSFHVGSQQRNVDAWDDALAEVAVIADALAVDDVQLALVNIGGGFPGIYQDAMPPMTAYGDAITRALINNLGHLYGEGQRFAFPQIIAEPGRYLVADAGVLQTEVVLVSKKHQLDDRRWVYLDCGKFGGLAETMEEAIRYRLRTPHDEANGPRGAVNIAGPTCDSADVLYEKSDYDLPMALAPGDRIDICSTGAYTTTYSAVNFNGFAPLKQVVI